MSGTDYPCAVCGAIACTDLLRAVDSGTTLTCDRCGGKTAISLHTCTEDMPAFIRRLHRERDEARALAARGRRALDCEDWRCCLQEPAETCPCEVCSLVRDIPEDW